MDRHTFTALDPGALPHYSRADLATAQLLDEVDALIEDGVTWPDEEPLPDPRELANAAASLAGTLQVLALDASPVGGAMVGNLWAALQRAQWLADELTVLGGHVDVTL